MPYKDVQSQTSTVYRVSFEPGTFWFETNSSTQHTTFLKFIVSAAFEPFFAWFYMNGFITGSTIVPPTAQALPQPQASAVNVVPHLVEDDQHTTGSQRGSSKPKGKSHDPAQPRLKPPHTGKVSIVVNKFQVVESCNNSVSLKHLLTETKLF